VRPVAFPATVSVRSVDGVSSEARVTTDPNRPFLYTALFTTPSTAEAWIEISPAAGLGPVRLLPIRVVGSRAAAPPPQHSALRGRHLYVAKGCIACHSHAEAAGMAFFGAGALELSGRTWPEPYLRRFLADPAGTRSDIGAAMPALGLSDTEIDALVAFLNGTAGS
jgi:mono/diheme cytochrome c family protein